MNDALISDEPAELGRGGERALVGLLSPEVSERLAALRALPDGAPGLYALRDALLLDDDANVRALAAEMAVRTTDEGRDRVTAWLVEALADPSPRVRDAAVRALARSKRREASPDIARLCLEEPAWWVRRAAVLAINALSPEQAAPTLSAALDDPFWRVRYPAILALASIGDRKPALRAAILREPEGVSEAGVSARVYLRWRWGASARPEPAPELAARADDGLWNPDPAVITARLQAARAGSIDPLRVIELLADPHEPLRRAAAAIARDRCDRRAIVAATLFLDQIRVPYANESAAALLDSLKSRAEPAARHALENGEAYAVEWAARFVAAHGSGALIEPLLARFGDADPRVRAAVTRALASLGEDVRSALDDADARVREAAILALVGLDDEGEGEASTLSGLALAAQAPGAQRALVEHAARTRDLRRLRAASRGSGVDALARARAVAARRSQADLGAEEREQLLRDDDPWIRAAALDLESAPHLAREDASPWVRRAALDALVTHRAAIPIEIRATLLDSISIGLDPWAKIRAAALVSADEGPRAFAALLRLFRDGDAGARASAEDALVAHPDLSTALHGVARSAEAGLPERLAAWTLLLRDADEPAALARRAALTDPSTPTEVRDLLAAMGPLFGEDPPQASTRGALSNVAALRDEAPPAAPSALALSKLTLSGVFELDLRCYERALDAGVSSFFWEPGYRTLQPFLRDPGVRRASRVVTGSYEGSPRSIRKDVERALKSLRRDALDVFLLFWVRSPERLSPEVIEVLSQLRREGKVVRAGFSTHHRDLARAAIERGGVDVVMTRHSAAHPGAERDLLPTARALGVGVITFSALSYGRLLRPAPDVASGEAKARSAGSAGWAPSFTAADCYRYSMKQPGAISCVAAPRDAAELEHDLEALASPALDEAIERELLAHGARVRGASRSFNDLVRMPRSGALFPSSAPPELAYELDLDLDLHPDGPAEVAPARRAAVGGAR